MPDFRFDVVADNVADVVDCAGGWIFDRVMQGWRVNVVVPHSCDSRPIEILGGTINRPISAECVATRICLEKASDTEEFGHRLSSAARPFKAQAMIAARRSPTTGRYERLFASACSPISGVNSVVLHAVTSRLPT